MYLAMHLSLCLHLPSISILFPLTKEVVVAFLKILKNIFSP